MTILHGFIFCFALSMIPLQSQDISVDEAVAIIANSHPISDFKPYAATSGGPAFVDKLRPIYDNQLRAIHIIDEQKPKNQVLNLIPYLDYISNAAYFSSGARTGSLEEIRRAWPVFSAIIDLPDAVPSLQQYSLNKQNPLDYRLSAFLVMRYIDKTSFLDVAKILDQELKASDPNVKVYLKHIEDGTYFFWGVRDANEHYYETPAH